MKRFLQSKISHLFVGLLVIGGVAFAFSPNTYANGYGGGCCGGQGYGGDCSYYGGR